MLNKGQKNYFFLLCSQVKVCLFSRVLLRRFQYLPVLSEKFQVSKGPNLPGHIFLMRLSLEGREINPSLIFNISRVQLRHGGHHRILARRCLCGHTARGVCTSRYRTSTLLYTMNCGAMAHARALLSLKRQ